MQLGELNIQLSPGESDILQFNQQMAFSFQGLELTSRLINLPYQNPILNYNWSATEFYVPISIGPTPYPTSRLKNIKQA